MDCATSLPNSLVADLNTSAVGTPNAQILLPANRSELFMVKGLSMAPLGDTPEFPMSVSIHILLLRMSATLQIEDTWKGVATYAGGWHKSYYIDFEQWFAETEGRLFNVMEIYAESDAERK